MTKVRFAAVGAALAATAMLSSCGGPDTAADGSETLTIAPQFGLTYLPHLVMMEEGYLTDADPDVHVEEVQLSGGGAVVEQLISGAIDVGYMGLGPFAKAIDSGADLRALTCMNQMPNEFVVSDPAVKTLTDVKDKKIQIALNSPASSQGMAMQVLTYEELGDADALTNQSIYLPHDEALSALTNGQVGGYWAIPPYLTKAEADGAHTIASTRDAFGEHCNIIAVSNGDFQDKKPAAYGALLAGIDKAVETIQEDPQVGVKALEASGDGTDPDQLASDITADGVVWQTEITGLQHFVDTLADAGLLNSPIDVTRYVTDDDRLG